MEETVQPGVGFALVTDESGQVEGVELTWEIYTDVCWKLCMYGIRYGNGTEVLMWKFVRGHIV